MVKSAPTLVGKLSTTATYEVLKAWSSAADDWFHSHIQAYPDLLAPTAICQVVRLTLAPALYAVLEAEGALGTVRQGVGATWSVMMDHLREKLGCTRSRLTIGLSTL
jgi:hypothetical protein